jgi:predicted alpha/beta hydrolase family esterase
MGVETQALFIPGWGNSESGHWQSLWCAELPHARRVIQREWIQVSVEEWVQTLDAFVQASAGPVVLVAHSLSCTLVSHWAARHDTSLVRAAMLVAPTDVEADTCPLETRCFAPIPLRQFPFRSVVVASEDDPYLTPSRARQFADAWGSAFVSAGNAGHINVKSGHGPWPAGKKILAGLT